MTIDRTVALKIATEGLNRARLILRSHEAALEMAREAGDKITARSLQAQINGLRTKVGKAAFKVRCAGGYA